MGGRGLYPAGAGGAQGSYPCRRLTTRATGPPGAYQTEEAVPRLMIDLTDDEWNTLRSFARTARRTPQAQAAQILVDVLKALAAEAQGDSRSAGGALAPGEGVGPVEGHRDGPGAGVDQIVVGRPGEPE